MLIGRNLIKIILSTSVLSSVLVLTNKFGFTNTLAFVKVKEDCFCHEIDPEYGCQKVVEEYFTKKINGKTVFIDYFDLLKNDDVNENGTYENSIENELEEYALNEEFYKTNKNYNSYIIEEQVRLMSELEDLTIEEVELDLLIDLICSQFCYNNRFYSIIKNHFSILNNDKSIVSNFFYRVTENIESCINLEKRKKLVNLHNNMHGLGTAEDVKISTEECNKDVFMNSQEIKVIKDKLNYLITRKNIVSLYCSGEKICLETSFWSFGGEECICSRAEVIDKGSSFFNKSVVLYKLYPYCLINFVRW